MPFLEVLGALTVIGYLAVAFAHDTAWVQRRLARMDDRSRQRRADGYKVNMDAVYLWTFNTRSHALWTACGLALLWFAILSWVGRS